MIHPIMSSEQMNEEIVSVEPIQDMMGHNPIPFEGSALPIQDILDPHVVARESSDMGSETSNNPSTGYHPS